MFRKRNSDHGSASSEYASPLYEISALMDKLDGLVDTSMTTFIDSIIHTISISEDNENNSNNNNEEGLTPARGTGILNSLRKYRFRKTKEEQEEETQTQVEEEVKEINSATDDDDDDGVTTTPTKAPPPTDSDNTPTPTKKKFRFGSVPKNKDARFVPMNDDETACFVETVRRISELVVIGESCAATIQTEESNLDNILRKIKNLDNKKNLKNDDEDNNSGDDGDGDGDDDDQQKEDWEEQCVRIREKISENNKYATVYEHFFERNGLAMIADVLTGKAFNISNFLDKRKRMVQTEIDGFNNDVEEEDNDNKQKRDRSESILKHLESIHETETYTAIVLVPPLAVATQGFQSTSILVQNVKRATSLFFILSNNHINQLIDFPLEEYHIAERKKLEGISGTTPSLMSPRRFGSPELGELTTTFVSFLKSLAMRMNAETLQFFLTYPSGTTIESDMDYLEETANNDLHEQNDDDDERPLDEIVSNVEKKDDIQVNRPVSVRTIQVEFPLYERALEFCSVHQDSFVRVTAMNICLNTLRLATVAPKIGDEDPAEVVVNLEAAMGASPDAVLHNAKPLPMRERLAIAQYVCTPSRVERLASPIFSKLAQLWGVLEEQFRDMEIANKPSSSSSSVGKHYDDESNIRKNPNDKVARAREIARRQKYTNIFNDTSYNVQDELLLLEDVLKVGLTSLNEQVIEMMFATFVYPLLLQPLLLYFQRSPVTAEVLFADTLNDHSLGRDIKQSDATATEKAVISAPAKSALFCLSAAFQFLTNPPLLRLLFTAVFHPLSPDASGETMIRAKADVACMGPDGKATIRIDRVDENGVMASESDRTTYIFGTITGRKEISGRRDSQPINDTCVFVLSPALSEILEFSGQDGGIVARSRHNPYRKAIFQCFTLNKEVSDLQALAVTAVHSAVSVFNEKFLADLLFGLDIKRYRDNLPRDERFNAFRENPDLDDDDFDDRGIGGSTISKVDSRLSLGALEGGKVGFDYMNEVIVSFESCIMNAVPGGKGAWKLDYDSLAAHALLSSIRGSSEAIVRASKAIEIRCRQSAAFLADAPSTIDKFDSEKLQSELKYLAPVNNGKCEKNDLYYGAIMDMIVRKREDSVFTEVKSALDQMLYLTKDLSNKEGDVSIYIPVTSVGSYNDVGARSITYSSLEQDAAQAAFSNAVESTSALLKLDAFGSLLNGLVHSKQILQDQKLGGFIFNRSIDPIIPNPTDGDTIFSPISDDFDNAMFGVDKNDSSFVGIKTGSVMSLVGKVAFPCVCEVPPSMAPLFSKEGAKVVSQGITWQSLYLVIIDQNLVLAEPERRSRGEGRVVTICKLENLALDKDPDDARVDTSARRLILICESPDLKSPGMFRFEKKPQPKQIGPFSHVERWKSSLDVWFEDGNALRIAFSKVDESIAKAKANRGDFIRRYLSQP
jgi:hypothetical protein